MKHDALDKIVQQAMFLGQIQYRTMIAPESDKIKQREARRYLQSIGIEPKMLDEWVDKKLVRRRKDGNATSPVYYSLREIQRQVTIAEMKKGDITTIYH